MSIQRVSASSAIDMIGPYLASKAVCPVCQKENILVHIESPASPVKPVEVCSHIKAHILDEDGNSHYEFEG